MRIPDSPNDPASPRAGRFEALFTRHYRQVLRYAQRRLLTPSAAEDVASEVFLTAWRRLDDVPDDPLPWLLRTAQGVVANHARSERRRERLHLEAANASRRPEAEPTTTEGALLEALASLPAKDQEALLLVAWEGLDHRRAAAAAGVSRVAFAARYARARRRLERAMATRAADAPPRPVTEERRSDLAS